MYFKEENFIETANSKTEDYSIVRTWMLPSLMEVLWRNRHREFPQNIFEINDVLRFDPRTESGVANVKKLCMIFSYSKASFSKMKSVVESFLNNLKIKEHKIEEVSVPYYIRGRAGKIIINGKGIGAFGEVSPKVLSSWELEMPVAACEINVDLLFETIKK